MQDPLRCVVVQPGLAGDPSQCGCDTSLYGLVHGSYQQPTGICIQARERSYRRDNWTLSGRTTCTAVASSCMVLSQRTMMIVISEHQWTAASGGSGRLKLTSAILNRRR